MMRILYVTSYYKPAYVYGGTVTAVSAICEALAKLDVSVTVLTTNANGRKPLAVPIGRPTMINGVEVFYYPVVTIPPRSYFYSPALASECERTIDRFNVTVLDTLWTHAMGPAIRSALRSGVPYVVPLHGQLMPWALNHHGFKKRVQLRLASRRQLNRAAALHCASHAEASGLSQLGLKAPAMVVPYGLNVDEYANLPARGGLRSRLAIDDRVSLVLFLGRLHRVKRPEVLLEALAHVHSAETHVVYAGSDEEGLGPKLLRLAAEGGYAHRVHLVGLLNRAEVLQALADADLLAMPSAMESFGMSAVEAMAAGVPILTSEEVPIGQWAEKSGAGLSVPGTIEAFADSLNLLLADAERLKEMGQKGRTLARERFDIEVVAHELLSQLQAIQANGRPLV